MKRGIIYLVLLVPSLMSAQGFENFITRDGHKLMDGDKQLRFVSWNIPNLTYVEDNMEFTETNPYDLPTEFELRDAFGAVKEMGGQVVRMYTIPVRNKNFPEDAVTYVEAPGVFNERAFQTLDTLMWLANEYEIRIVFSLLNNWQWMGGVPNYADFRDKTFDDFWTDKQLRDDFKKTIEFVINRTNTVTGVKYKDDKAILCWETGNELVNTEEWTRDIVRYIKKLDKKHLIMDGYHAINARPVRKSSVDDPNIDIIVGNHYERGPLETIKNIKRNLSIVDGKKPYIIREYGFQSTKAIESVLDIVLDNDKISGAMLWSLRYRNKNGGFYWHSEPMGIGIYRAYHWPGFSSGAYYDEKNIVTLFANKAHEIQGKEYAPLPPKAPKLLPIDHVYDIRWQGVVGAVGYNVERSTTPDGPWHLVGANINDAEIETFANFGDETATIGEEYYYRIKTIKSNGISGASNVVGPVKVKQQAVIDNLLNYGKVYHYHNVEPVSGEDRSYKEISSRFFGDYGAEMIYHVPGDFKSFKVFSFEGNQNWQYLSFQVSEDGKNWQNIEWDVKSYASTENNYGYSIPKIYLSVEDIENIKYLKIHFEYKVHLARVEVIYE